jgi:hypothetical protein
MTYTDIETYATTYKFQDKKILLEDLCARLPHINAIDMGLATKSRFVTERVRNKLTQLEPFFDEELNVPQFFQNDKTTRQVPTSETFTIGAIYSLPNTEIDGIEVHQPKYKLHGIVRDYKNAHINALAMTLVDQEKSRIFALTRQQCMDLNIPFQHDLQLLPMSLPWKKQVEPSIMWEKMDGIDTNDMSTFPNLDYFTVKLGGFRSYNELQIITPNNCVLYANEFLRSLRCLWENELYLPHRIITREIIKSNNNRIIDDNGNIYFIIDVRSLKLTRDKLKGKKLSDYLVFDWEEIVHNDNCIQSPLPDNMRGRIPNGMRRTDGIVIEEFQNGEWKLIQKINNKGFEEWKEFITRL